MADIVALGDRYRKFYQTLITAKRNHSIQYSIQKNSKIFIQNFIHSKSTQKYSFKELFIQRLAHSKNYSFKFSTKYSIKILFIRNTGKLFTQRIYSFKV